MSAPHMTLDEFLEALPETRNGWQREGFGRFLRRVRDGHRECPLTALANDRHARKRPYGIFEYHQAGKRMGLSEVDCCSIAEAADGYTPRGKLVGRIAKAVGL